MTLKQPERSKKESEVIFAFDKNGAVEWLYPLQRPDLTSEEAMVVGINKGAKALSDIAESLNAVANALDRLADTKK